MHTGIEAGNLLGNLLRRCRVEVLLTQIYHIADTLNSTRTEGALGVNQRLRGVNLRPIHRSIGSTVGNRAYLQHIEDIETVPSIQIRCELYLHRTLHLALGNFEQFDQNLRQREGVVFEDMGKGYALDTLNQRGVHKAHILHIPGRCHVLDILEVSAVGNAYLFEVYGIVERSLELVGLQI